MCEYFCIKKVKYILNMFFIIPIKYEEIVIKMREIQSKGKHYYCKIISCLGGDIIVIMLHRNWHL